MANSLGFNSATYAQISGLTTIDGLSYVFVYDTDHGVLRFFDGTTVGGQQMATGSVAPASASIGYFFAGPTSGPAAAPSFRPITMGDLPQLNQSNGLLELDSSTKITTTFLYTNVAGGVPLLDSSGLISTAQLPASVQGALDYQGTWNASTNTPALASGTGSKGYYYTVSVTGGTTLDGISQWNAGDHAAFNGTVWEKLDGLASEVISVNGFVGTVALTSTNIPEGTNLYFTNARASAAAPVQTVNGAAGAVVLSTSNIAEGSNLYYTNARASAAAPVQSVNGHVGAAVVSASDVNAPALNASGQIAIAAAPALRGWIAGLILSSASTTTVGVTAGQATDSTNVILMNETGALTVSISSTGANALDTGTVAASTWYHVHLIATAAGATVAALLSLSATAPTLPATYLYFRRIGSIKTNASSQVTAFFQDEETFYWTTSTLAFDFNTALVASTSVLGTLNVPTGVKVRPLTRFGLSGTAAPTIISSPDEPDINPAVNTVSPESDINATAGSVAPWIYTNTSAQVRMRSSGAPTINGITSGWVESRGRFL